MSPLHLLTNSSECRDKCHRGTAVNVNLSGDNTLFFSTNQSINDVQIVGLKMAPHWCL